MHFKETDGVKRNSTFRVVTERQVTKPQLTGHTDLQKATTKLFCENHVLQRVTILGVIVMHGVKINFKKWKH